MNQIGHLFVYRVNGVISLVVSCLDLLMPVLSRIHVENAVIIPEETPHLLPELSDINALDEPP
jgi:hypothetical protein